MPCACAHDAILRDSRGASSIRRTSRPSFAVKVREKHQRYILKLARQSAVTGEPLMRSLEYAFPHQGYERINDQFLLGDRLLVAPVLEKDARNRAVVLPAGSWRGFDGKRYAGPAKVTVPVRVDELCYFERTD
ncbi:MAG: glycoside hydrolase family 31 protein [Verrucomicrobiota bacterium]